ncbi:GPP34 family phosphoprotein [Nocardioides sp. W3-2-3]|uniref:GPP34 family phosphoprotein n=1 Tax=Nocardioides convexus TaxID=2712224 RepID=UPI002418AFD2|nr:GPP34 family phosphoprotein [Nocardioides convexus]NGZ99441.1 GPP34 family phosphoprotein [Nocardioides convexus]
MTIASDLVLLTLDPTTGRSLLGSTATVPVLGGAVLVDLVLAERCAVEGDPKWAKARLLSGAPLGSAPHDRALTRLKPGSEVRVRNLVPRIGKRVREDVLDQARRRAGGDRTQGAAARHPPRHPVRRPRQRAA